MKAISFALCIIGILFNQRAPADDATNSIPPQHANVYWGASTNGISASVYVETASTNVDNLVPVRLHFGLYNASTNNGNIMPNWIMLLAPPLEDRYRLELKDENEKEVEKTAKGRAMGKRTPQPYRVKPNSDGVTIDTGWRPGKINLMSREVLELTPPLLLSDYFKIERPGKYHLRCEILLFRFQDDINKQDLISFPPVDAEIEIKKQ